MTTPSISRPGPGRAHAAVLREYDGPLAVEELPVPEPGPGAVVVRVVAATVCGSDVHLWHGHTKDVLPTRLPLILGHEIVGAIVAIGEGAGVDSLGTKLAAGDRIVWTPAPCRSCHVCTVVKMPNLCPNLMVGMHQSIETHPHVHGGFSEVVYVSPRMSRVRVPDDVADTWAAAASCAGRSACSAVRTAGRIDVTDHVLVQGAGPLGLFVVAMTAVSSPRSLIVVDLDPARLELAGLWGATHLVEFDRSGRGAHRRQVTEITGDRGVNFGFECSGSRGAFAEGIDLMGRGGVYTVSGAVGGPRQDVDVSRLCLSGLRVQGVFSAGIEDYWRTLEFMRTHAGRVRWDAMFSGPTYGLQEVEAALRSMEARTQVKPVILPRSGGES